MQDAPKAVWSIGYVSVAFFPNLKQNFITYCSSKVSECIFEIHLLWQSGFSRMYSNSCCSFWFEPEIIKISQSSHQMYSNKILNFQGSTIILNACTKKSQDTYWMHHIPKFLFLSLFPVDQVSHPFMYGLEFFFELICCVRLLWLIVSSLSPLKFYLQPCNIFLL